MKTASIGRFLALTLVQLIAVPAANAELFYHEDFDYQDGNLTTVSGGLWAAHSGAGNNPVQVSGGKIMLTQGSGSREDVNRSTGSALGQGETWYAGFDLTVMDVTATGSVEDHIAHFLQGTSNFNARVYISAPQSGGGYRLGIVGGSTTPSVKWGSDLTLGETYRVVVSYTLDPDNNSATQDSFAKMWIDPVDESSTSVMQVSNFSNSVTAFAFRQGGTAAIGSQMIDNVCVATTFGEAAFCIPEPATLTLVGLASVAMVALMRRRS